MASPFRTIVSLLFLGASGMSCGSGPGATMEPAASAPRGAPAAAPPAPAAKAASEVDAAPWVGIPGASRPLPGLLTGGQPTPDQFTEAARLGYRKVISLRPEAEPGAAGERDLVESLGMRFVSIPIASSADLTESNARILAEALSGEGNTPLIVHCGTGNRVGALLALEAYHVEGKSADEALALGKAAGLTTLEAAVREHIENSPK